MNYIDDSTVPSCKIEEKKFEWGEPYELYTPIFNFADLSDSKLENSIKLFGKNNFKQQLLLIYNIINNYEEFENIENYNGELFEREEILNLIKFYINRNENLISPWEKYDIGLKEYDFIKYLDEKLEKLNYVKLKDS
ncbi:hypothetical protein [Chryseobacterium sp. IT-36CA2]|uniref:hypothetical protein n=1 Tax=Chryseobacterium sp. IT-36CA2 TaxID=3026460 RepID=UPI0039E01EA0